jgi:hypothetical protein
MVDDPLRQPGCFEMNTTLKFYLFALFIALIGFAGTSFIMRIQQATAAAAPAKLTIAAPGRGGLPRHVVIDRRCAMEDRQDAAIETS